MLRKFFLAFLLLSTAVVSAWQIKPVTTINDSFFPRGTVVKKLLGSTTFVLDEIASSGASVVQVDANSGPILVATPAFQIGATKINIGANVPATAVGISLAVFNGDLIVGYTGTIATGTIYTGIRIASGTSMNWTGIIPGTLVLYGLANQSGSVDCRLSAW